MRAAAQPRHLAVAGGVLLLGAVLAVGAWGIPSAAGYGGVGPNFLPWVVSAALALCGAALLAQALRGGFVIAEAPSGAQQADWLSMLWVAAGVLVCAGLITRIGFILACAVCFMLAVRGLRRAGGAPSGGAAKTAIDALTGLAIAAPVYWVFTKLLRINLPGLTGSGWL
jgi:putative tricarboxylic transport membrane protein